jgi:hypothetical protein
LPGNDASASSAAAQAEDEAMLGEAGNVSQHLQVGLFQRPSHRRLKAILSCTRSPTADVAPSVAKAWKARRCNLDGFAKQAGA